MALAETPIPPDMLSDNPCYFKPSSWHFLENGNTAAQICLPKLMEAELEKKISALEASMDSPEFAQELCEFLWNKFVPTARFYQLSNRQQLLWRIESSPAYNHSVDKGAKGVRMLNAGDRAILSTTFEDNYVFFWHSFFQNHVLPAIET